MRTPQALLKLIARAALNHVGFGAAGEFSLEVMPDLAREVWNGWIGGRDPQKLRDDLEALAQLSPQELRQEAESAAAEVAGGRPEEVRRALVIFLMQLPGAVRQSLRRPNDPSGRTAPPGLVLKEADDLLPFLPTRLPRFQPGDRPPGVGDWELTDLLGSGGFGEVWKAKHVHFDGIAPVALKFCLDDASKERLLKHEAAVLNQVMRQGRHPGIIELRHTYLSADPPCLEYEFVEGGDLGGVIREWHRAPVFALSLDGPPPVIAQATRMLCEMAQTVAFAHGLNPSIVHRDLKPANILMQREKDGKLTPRVADFGIGGVASRQAIQRTQRSVTGGAFLTTALRGSHTPLYASPQQILGKPADPRDDVHALGVVWYQMLSGDLSRGRPSGKGWRRQLTEKGMAADLLDLLESCVDDDPEERPRDAGVLAQRLASLLDAQTPRRKAAPPPPPPIPTPPPVRKTPVGGPPVLVVSPHGRGGEHTTIGSALRAAAPGTRITVRPGHYNEALVLDKHVEIVAEGRVDEVVIQATDDTVLVMKTDQALVRGLTLRSCKGSQDKKCFAVDIPQGRLVLEDCHVTSDTLSNVSVHGGAADPIIRRCKLHDGTESGVFFWDNGRGTVEDCDIYNNSTCGVAIKSGSTPLVRRCKIHSDKQSGVLVYDDGKGTIEDCDISANTTCSVAIRKGADPVVRRCNIHDDKQSGVLVYKEGLGTVEDCQIFSNGNAGVEIREGGASVIRRCRIRDSRQSGIWVYDDGRGVIEDCEVTANNTCSVAIKTGGNPILRRCKIHDDKQSGVLVYENGKGTFEDCDVYSNTTSSIAIKSGGDPVIRRCKVHDDKQSGVWIYEDGKGTVEECDVYNNTTCGIAIRKGGDPVVRRCKVHDDKQGGVLCYEDGRGVVEDCEIWGNASAGLAMKAGAETLIRRCKIRDGKQGGVLCYENGRGTVEDCDVTGNAKAGVEIRESSTPLIRRCRINGNAYQAVYVHDKGGGTVEYCDLTGNKHGAWNIEAGCTIRRVGNKE